MKLKTVSVLLAASCVKMITCDNSPHSLDEDEGPEFKSVEVR